MQIKRREFLKKSLVVGGMVAVGPSLHAQPKTFDPYEQIPLGKTKLKVSRLCLGTGMKGWKRESNHTRLGREKFEALIRGAYDRGICVFDLADLYGTHSYVVSALKGIPRDKYVIITKIWWRPDGLPETERPDADVLVPRFLKELNTDYIDVLLLHCCTSGKWPEELRKQMDLLSKFKKEGIIRAHGISCHSLEALDAAADEPWVETINVRINPYGVKMDGPPEKVVPILKRIHDAGKGVVGMKLIGEGKFRDDDEKRNESVRFVLGLGSVDVLDVGFEKLEEIDDFAKRVRKVSRV
ncbi:MAG: aldo/keto reductase [Verrucomicrobia bacterium]|nr:aldo/keto reductase [Verrucomicrobiota bacterium]